MKNAVSESYVRGTATGPWVAKPGGGGGTPPPTTFTYYVATTGSDSNPGTITQPFLTPAYAASRLTVDGQSLAIRAGTYYIPTPRTDGITPQPAIFPRAFNCLISAYPGESVTLIGGVNGANYGIAPCGGVLGSDGKGGTIFENMTIVGLVIFANETVKTQRSTIRHCEISVGGDSNGGMYQGNVILLNHGADHIHIFNNKIHDGVDLTAPPGTPYGGGGGGTGIIGYGVNDILIEQNTIHNHSHGIFFKDDAVNCVVTRNHIYSNRANGIWFGNNTSAVYPKSADVYQNIITGNNTLNDDGSGGIRFVYEMNLVNIYNNVLYNNNCAELRHLGFPGAGVPVPIPYTYFNNIVSATGTAANYRNSYSIVYPVSIDYMDYNHYVSEARGWSHAYANSFTTLATWKSWLQSQGISVSGASLATAENSSVLGNAGFVNGSGGYSVPSDFKRGSYPTNGRGGAYPNVIGAYITGTEQIGADW